MLNFVNTHLLEKRTNQQFTPLFSLKYELGMTYYTIFVSDPATQDTTRQEDGRDKDEFR